MLSMRPLNSGESMIHAGFQAFNAAPDGAKTIAAVHWLANMSRKLRSAGILSLNVMYINSKDRMREVREMLWSIPKEHPVFTQAWEEASRVTDCCLDKISWMRDYAGLEDMSLLRDMWLARTPVARLAALHSLANRTAEQRENISRSSDAFMRLAAWAVAVENEMDADSVVAATKITIDLFRGYHRNETRAEHPPVMDAIMVILARGQDGPDAYSSHFDMKEGEAKALLVESPAICAQVLTHMWGDSSFRFRHAVIGETPKLTEDSNQLESLRSWFPGQTDMIDMAEHMGLDHRETLAQLSLALLGEHGWEELPPDIVADF